MKSKFILGLAVITLALTSAFSMSALAQTADDGSGPSEQPSAPMEMGQDQSGQSAPQSGPQYGSDNDNDARPTDAEPGGPEGEEPAKSDQGVARVSMIHGDVSTQRGDSGDWSAATLNQPVMGGDNVSTGDGARAELQLDFANILRLGSNSRANITNLTHKDIQIQLSQGIANYTVSKDSELVPEIDTPNVAVHPSHHDGIFRIEVQPDGDTIVIVRQGEAQIATPQGSTEIHAGEMATVRGNADSAQYKISSASDRDDFDRWNSERDHVIRNAQSWHHTNRYYTGAEDLDAYGRWKHVPDYGDVWVPEQNDDWAPYRDGNWTYEPSYGWTWVGYEPWGWAPYHYGRWFYYDNSWAWWPGPVTGFYRPFWAPAYVSFWGWGGGFGFGVGYGGWGGFGWLPIGPCDRFHPWWGGYRGRFGVVNARFGNGNRFGGFRPLHGGNRFSNVNNIHNNHVFRGMSTVDAGHFGAGRMRPHAMTRQQLGGARMMAGNLPVVPTRASLSASGRAAAPSTIRNGGSQRFFGTPHNNLARPESFQQHTAALQRTMQQNHVGAIPAGGRTAGFTNPRNPTAGNTSMKPSAGTFQGGRQMNNPGTRSAGNSPAGNRPSNLPSNIDNGNRGGSRPFNSPGSNNPRSVGPTIGGPARMEPQRGTSASEPLNRGGFRPFTPPSNTSPRSSMGPVNSGSRSTEAPRSMNRPPESVNRGGFRPFTPPSSSQGSRNDVSRGAPNMSAQRSSNNNYWNRTAPSSQMHTNGPVYGGSGNYGGSGSSSRPRLDMRQPIVRSPSYGGYQGGSRPSYGGGYGGGSRSVPPSYSAPRSMPSYGGGGRAPSYGGGGRAPSYGGGGGHSAPSSGGGGGHVSAPSGGGGHSSGGGGGHSSSGGHSSNGHR